MRELAVAELVLRLLSLPAWVALFGILTFSVTTGRQPFSRTRLPRWLGRRQVEMTPADVRLHAAVIALGVAGTLLFFSGPGWIPAISPGSPPDALTFAVVVVRLVGTFVTGIGCWVVAIAIVTKIRYRQVGSEPPPPNPAAQAKRSADQPSPQP
jgi:hypothetical protein